MKRLLKNGYLMFFGCIVLNGNALHAVVFFRNTKSEKKGGKKFCCLISTSWLCDVYWPRLSYWARSLSLSLSLFLSLSMSLFLFHVVLWILVTFHSMQSLQSPMLWCSEQTASELVLVCDNFFLFFLSFALTCLKWEPSHWQKKKYFRLFKWTGFYFFYALLLTQCTKGLNETCSFALTLCVISSVVISLVFLCSLVSYVVVFFPKMLCRFKHNKCLALSVRGYFHITETMNNNQSIHHALLVA